MKATCRTAAGRGARGGRRFGDHGPGLGRDPLCVVQLCAGDGDAHVVRLNRPGYDAPNLKRLLDRSGGAEDLPLRPVRHRHVPCCTWA